MFEFMFDKKVEYIFSLALCGSAMCPANVEGENISFRVLAMFFWDLGFYSVVGFVFSDLQSSCKRM